MPSRLTYSKSGDPIEVLRKEDCPLPNLEDGEVLLEMLAAPVNPVDINIIQGKYPMHTEAPGYEGVARVVKVGSHVENLIVGDHVVPMKYVGTWRTHLALPEAVLLKVPKELGLAEAATLAINPPTMYRMLKDYVQLQAGDTVVQNGANSACGVIAIQLCRIWGIKTVNVIRDRPDIGKLKNFLKDLGATYVFTEEEFAKTDIFKSGALDKPLLALNCVGGKSATQLVRQLDFGGVLVTYGGMSMEPISVPTSALIFRDIRLEGFNINRWYENEDNITERAKMYTDLISLLSKGELKAPPHVFVSFENYKDAIKNTLSKNGMVGKKYILDYGVQFNNKM
ncbi:enoyl-[acyl-carrier-protein] reductase, mitochondrial [Leptinotarsa decemlineata]|uniref:enoyl-[acyl-carrier-protein] reductase, mitochondrial n=1 Tax=Leptinotarsa decemlineata TaxID=7539 RepID=UPI003D30526D